MVTYTQYTLWIVKRETYLVVIYETPFLKAQQSTKIRLMSFNQNNEHELYRTLRLFTLDGFQEWVNRRGWFLCLFTSATWRTQKPLERDTFATDGFRTNPRRANVAVADRLLSASGRYANEWISLLVNALHKWHSTSIHAICLNCAIETQRPWRFSILKLDLTTYKMVVVVTHDIYLQIHYNIWTSR